MSPASEPIRVAIARHIVVAIAFLIAFAAAAGAMFAVGLAIMDGRSELLGALALPLPIGLGAFWSGLGMKRRNATAALVAAIASTLGAVAIGIMALVISIAGPCCSTGEWAQLLGMIVTLLAVAALARTVRRWDLTAANRKGRPAAISESPPSGQ